MTPSSLHIEGWRKKRKARARVEWRMILPRFIIKFWRLRPSFVENLTSGDEVFCWKKLRRVEICTWLFTSGQFWPFSLLFPIIFQGRFCSSGLPWSTCTTGWNQAWPWQRLMERRREEEVSLSRTKFVLVIKKNLPFVYKKFVLTDPPYTQEV